MAAKATLRTVDTPQHITQTTIVGSEEVQRTETKRVTLRTLSVLEEMRLLKILGEYNSSYFSFCAAVSRVASIDGQMVPLPNNEREIEALASRLGRDGVASLMEEIAAGNLPENAESQRNQIKN
jgi:hypothetical protein